MAGFKTVSPIDGQVILERPFATARQMEQVLARSELAGRDWKKQTLQSRLELINRAMDILVEDVEEAAREITLQMGRPIAASPGEIFGMKERSDYMLEVASQTLADYVTEKVSGFERYITREPVGTVLVIAPWNYPYLTAINVVVPALASGNTVLLKHSPQTPLCAERLQDAFLRAGLPDGVFQYLHMTHDHAGQLIQDSRIGFVNFTGSVATGKAVQRAACGRFISLGLELGGKDPALVREDANITFVSGQLVEGAFFNSGQSCCGVERIYVHQRVFNDFVECFVEAARQYQLKNPFDPAASLGPVVSARAADFVRGQVRDAVLQGAQSLISENDFTLSQPGSAYLAPQVLIKVNHGMNLMREESFGPVAGIMPVESDLQAIELMNDSNYGLTASIWTSDSEAVSEIGRQLETGTVFMNRCDYLDPSLVWTGVKNTGQGRSLSVFGYDSVIRLKSYHLKLEQC